MMDKHRDFAEVLVQPGDFLLACLAGRVEGVR